MTSTSKQIEPKLQEKTCNQKTG